MIKRKITAICALILCAVSIISNLPDSTGRAEERAKELSYDRALELALDNLSSVLSLDDSIRHLEAQREHTRRQIGDIAISDQYIRTHTDTVNHIMANISSTNAEIARLQAMDDPDLLQIAMLENFLVSLHSWLSSSFAILNTAQEAMENAMVNREILRHRANILDRQIDALKINIEMLQTATELSLRVRMTNIAGIERNIQLAETEAALLEEDVRRVGVLHGRGRASANELRAAELRLNQANVLLDDLRLRLENELVSLNEFLGLPLTSTTSAAFPDSRLGMTYMPNTRNVQVSAASNLTTALLEIELEINRLNLEIARTDMNNRRNATGRGRNAEENRLRQRMYESARIEFDNATRRLNASRRELTDARINLEANVLTHTNELRRLALAETRILPELNAAESSLGVSEALYTAGRLSRLDVAGAAASVLRLEIELENNRDSRWVESFRGMNTFLLG